MYNLGFDDLVSWAVVSVDIVAFWFVFYGSVEVLLRVTGSAAVRQVLVVCRPNEIQAVVTTYSE